MFQFQASIARGIRFLQLPMRHVWCETSFAQKKLSILCTKTNCHDPIIPIILRTDYRVTCYLQSHNHQPNFSCGSTFSFPNSMTARKDCVSSQKLGIVISFFLKVIKLYCSPVVFTLLSKQSHPSLYSRKLVSRY